MRVREALAYLWLGSARLRAIVLTLFVIALVMVLLALAGCAEAPAKPMVMTVERKLYVPVPDTLTNACTIAEKQDVALPDTAQLVLGGMNAQAAYWFAQFAQAAGVAKLRKTSLQKCNADKAAIKAIQGTPVPTNGGH